VRFSVTVGPVQRVERLAPCRGVDRAARAPKRWPIRPVRTNES